jgi:hypothetical protein
MDPQTFETADHLVDVVADAIDDYFESPEAAKIRGFLVKMAEALGDRFSVEFTCTVHVFDRAKERTLPLLSTGLSTGEDQAPYRTWNDSTPQRYLIDGEIQVVPHDRCPR